VIVFDDPERLERLKDNIRQTIKDVVIPPSPLPDDVEKTDADWEEDERRSAWRQAAFDRYWLLANTYLDAMVGGQQTSRDLHMVCQGMAMVMDVLPRFITAQQNLAESDAPND
jgi:hypothetical protein